VRHYNQKMILLDRETRDWQPNIMLADDDPVVRTYVTENLNSLGYKQVVTAENGLEASALIHDYAIHKNNPFELIILDLNMPHMTGKQFLEFNINRGLLFQTPIILHSSDEPFFPILDQAKRHANIVDFLSKNKMSIHDLAFSVKKALTVLAPNQEIYQCFKTMRYDLIEIVNTFDKNKISPGPLKLFRQPIYNLSTMELIGYELLLRWNHQNQVIQPNQIIHLCKEYGILKYLSAHILRLTTHILKNTQNENQFYTMNIDPDDLEEADFFVFLLQTIKEQPFLKDKLFLEITEETMVKNIEKLRELRAAGYQLYLDDFGSGNANLEKLYPLFQENLISKVKIDRTFIKYLMSGKSGEVYYQDIIRIIQNLGLDYVMEGIETAEILEKLKNLVFPSKVNVHGQGYFFGRPEAIPV